jgi:hypothetical protein
MHKARPVSRAVSFRVLPVRHCHGLATRVNILHSQEGTGEVPHRGKYSKGGASRLFLRSPAMEGTAESRTTSAGLLYALPLAALGLRAGFPRFATFISDCRLGGIERTRRAICSSFTSSGSLSSATWTPQSASPCSISASRSSRKITSGWAKGYIEMYVDMTMMHLLSIKNFGTFDTVMAGKNSGSKVSLLLQLANGISTKDAALKPPITAFCERHNEIVGKRHHAVHGIWHIGPDGPAAFSWKRRADPLKRRKLPSLASKTEELTRLAQTMWGNIYFPGRDFSKTLMLFDLSEAGLPSIMKDAGVPVRLSRAPRLKRPLALGRSSKGAKRSTRPARRPKT